MQHLWKNDKQVMPCKDTSNCLQYNLILIKDYWLMRPCRAPYSSGFLLRLSEFSLVGNIIDHGRTSWSIILPTNERSDSLIRKPPIRKKIIFITIWRQLLVSLGTSIQHFSIFSVFLIPCNTRQYHGVWRWMQREWRASHALQLGIAPRWRRL